MMGIFLYPTTVPIVVVNIIPEHLNSASIADWFF